jgi:hypothetical protein
MNGIGGLIGDVHEFSTNGAINNPTNGVMGKTTNEIINTPINRVINAATNEIINTPINGVINTPGNNYRVGGTTGSSKAMENIPTTDNTEADIVNHLKIIPGIGDALAVKLYDMGVRQLSDLTTEKYWNTLSNLSRLHIKYKINHNLSRQFVNEILSLLPEYLIPVGSYRRGNETMKDLDLLTTKPLDETLKDFRNVKYLEFAGGEHKKTLLMKYKRVYFICDLIYVPEESLPTALFHYTGNKIFNIRTRAQAKRLGYKLSQYGLYKDGERIPVKSEEEIFEILQIDYKKPEERNE